VRGIAAAGLVYYSYYIVEMFQPVLPLSGAQGDIGYEECTEQVDV
jgi:hypothetical protein